METREAEVMCNQTHYQNVMAKNLAIAAALASFLAGPALVSGQTTKGDAEESQLEDRSLRNSDGSRFVPKDFYPEFSWEATPVYYMFGDKNKVLRPEQVRFIAERTDFLCIEKSHGMGQLGAAELGAKHEAAAFKKGSSAKSVGELRLWQVAKLMKQCGFHDFEASIAERLSGAQFDFEVQPLDDAA